MPIRITRALFVLAVAATIWPMHIVEATDVHSAAVTVEKPLTDDDGDEAVNISGISCLPEDAGSRKCLVIDDEGRMAQALFFDGSRLAGRGKIRIIPKKEPVGIIGTAPTVDRCSKGSDKFKDLDGEAVAYDGKDFYVVGSHGCSRHSRKFRTSSFIVARVPQALVVASSTNDAQVIEDASVNTSYRVSEALLLAPHVKEFFASDLTEAGGLNVEGLLVIGDNFYAGLRAPIVAGQAYIIELPISPLFDGKLPITASDVREHALDLGDGRGVRDLTTTPDGRVLVLAGPSREEDVTYALYLADPKAGWSTTQLAVLDDIPKPVTETKAEALQVLAQSGSMLDVLIMFDGPKSGGPRRYSVTLK